jgi:hypothetical protein
MWICKKNQSIANSDLASLKASAHNELREPQRAQELSRIRGPCVPLENNALLLTFRMRLPRLCCSFKSFSVFVGDFDPFIDLGTADSQCG